MMVRIPADLVSEIRTIVQNIEDQDNRCTASPYFYVIQEKRKRLVPPGFGDDIYVDTNDCEPESMTTKEAMKRRGLRNDKGRAC